MFNFDRSFFAGANNEAKEFAKRIELVYLALKKFFYELIMSHFLETSSLYVSLR